MTTELTHPFHLDGNYAPVTREVTVNDLPVEGRVPEALSGCYVRNGPNPKRGGGSTHWFYGDGMVHGVELADGRARWYRNRRVRTSTFTDDARVVRPDFTIDRRAGVAHTNVIQHGGRMLALVETSYPELWRDGSNNFGAAQLHRWTIETGKEVHEQPLDEHVAEFPRIDDRRTGLEHRFGYAIHHTEPLTGAILRYDLTAGTTSHGRRPSRANPEPSARSRG